MGSEYMDLDCKNLMQTHKNMVAALAYGGCCGMDKSYLQYHIQFSHIFTETNVYLEIIMVSKDWGNNDIRKLGQGTAGLFTAEFSR